MPGNLRYPELTDDYDYKGKVKFSIVKEQELNLSQERFEQAANTINNSIEQGTVSQAEVNENEILRDPVDLFETGFSDAAISNSPLTDLTKGSCTLYLPQGIQMADTIDYENLNLGVLGVGVQAGVSAGENAAQVIGSALANEFSAISDALSTGAGTEAGRLALARAAARRGSDAIRGGVTAATRRVMNPNSRAFFRSVNLREFSFQYKLIAESKREAETIKEIIKFFRSNMYPEDIEIENFSVAYKFPPRFKIHMNYDGRTVATKILPAYLRNFNATYNSTSMGMHSDGNFVEVDIVMQFQESRALKKSEIRDEDF